MRAKWLSWMIYVLARRTQHLSGVADLLQAQLHTDVLGVLPLRADHVQRPCHPTCVDGQKSQDKSLSDRKSTRLNSSHLVISYAVFCLKKKIRNRQQRPSDVTTPQSSRQGPTCG